MLVSGKMLKIRQDPTTSTSDVSSDRASLPTSTVSGLSPTPSATPTETVTFPFTTMTFYASTPTSSAAITSALSSQSSSASGTISPGNPAPSPSLIFVAPSNVTTCNPLPIHWSVVNPSSNLSSVHINLFITNIGVKRDSVNATIANLPILNKTYIWPAATVQPGTYAILGIGAPGSGLHAQSPTFPVQAGSNTSCLAPASSSSTTTSGLSRGTMTGAIAGGTIGGLLLLACAGVALFFLSGMHKTRKVNRKRTSRRRGWGGLSSMDSKASRSRDPPCESNDRLRACAGAAATARVDSEVSLEKAVPDSSVGHDGLPVVGHININWNRVEADPRTGRSSVELARMPSRHAVPDSPRSSLEIVDPFVATPEPPTRRSSRTPRKPVPAYEPTPEEAHAMAMACPLSDHSHGHSNASVSHHPSASLSMSSVSQHGEALIHGLKSKASGHFHEGPMHYLIPDMPARDAGYQAG